MYLKRKYADKCIQVVLLTTYYHFVPVAALFGNISNHPRRIGHIDPNCDVIECVSSKYKDLLRCVVMKCFILLNLSIYKRTHNYIHTHISKNWRFFSH